MSTQCVSARHFVRPFIADRSGAAALEFAILGPLFIMLTFGVIVLGWALYTMSSVNFVAERVGRLLQLNPSMSSSEVSESVKADLSNLDQANLAVSLLTETNSSGYQIARATVSYAFSVDIPLFGSFPVNYSTTVSVPML